MYAVRTERGHTLRSASAKTNAPLSDFVSANDVIDSTIAPSIRYRACETLDSFGVRTVARSDRLAVAAKARGTAAAGETTRARLFRLAERSRLSLPANHTCKPSLASNVPAGVSVFRSLQGFFECRIVHGADLIEDDLSVAIDHVDAWKAEDAVVPGDVKRIVERQFELHVPGILVSFYVERRFAHVGHAAVASRDRQHVDFRMRTVHAIERRHFGRADLTPRRENLQDHRLVLTFRSETCAVYALYREGGRLVIDDPRDALLRAVQELTGFTGDLRTFLDTLQGYRRRDGRAPCGIVVDALDEWSSAQRHLPDLIRFASALGLKVVCFGRARSIDSLLENERLTNGIAVQRRELLQFTDNEQDRAEQEYIKRCDLRSGFVGRAKEMGRLPEMMAMISEAYAGEPINPDLTQRNFTIAIAVRSAATSRGAQTLSRNGSRRRSMRSRSRCWRWTPSSCRSALRRP